MLYRTTLAAAVLAACAGLAAAQDVRREDRGVEAEREVEVKRPLPRNADGTIDRAALLREVRAQLAAGATEIQFRDGALSAADARALASGERSLLADLAAALPNDGIERQIRLRGGIDARVQRNEEGELRARIEGLQIGSLTAAQRAELAQRLAAQGFDRVRIRDGAGTRVEFRADRGIVKNEARAERGERAQRAEREDHRGRHERAERAERPERLARVERPERPERAERVERPERAERAERPERVQRPDNSGRR